MKNKKISLMIVGGISAVIFVFFPCSFMLIMFKILFGMNSINDIFRNNLSGGKSL